MIVQIVVAEHITPPTHVKMLFFTNSASMQEKPGCILNSLTHSQDACQPIRQNECAERHLEHVVSFSR